jgi:hypothetical protein
VAAVLVAWFRAPGRRVRRAAVLALVLLGVAALALTALGAPLNPGSQPLTTDGAYGGEDPLLIAVTDGPGTGSFEYAYEPGAEIRTGLTLANDGNAPLTVTGLGPPPFGSFVAGYKFLLPPGPLTSDLVPLYPGTGPNWTSEPFHPFEIPAHGQVGLGLAVDLRNCPKIAPGPTLAPGASPSYTGLNDAVGFEAADSLEVSYSAFGIARTATVLLQSPLAVVTGDASGPDALDCPNP